MSQAQESQDQIKSSKINSSNHLILNIVRNTSKKSIDKDRNQKIPIKKKLYDSVDRKQQSIKKSSKSPKLNKTVDQSYSRSGTRINLGSQAKLPKNTLADKRISVSKRTPPLNPKLTEEKVKQSILKKQLLRKEAELQKITETANILQQKLNSKVKIIKSGDQFQSIRSGEQFQTVKSVDQPNQINRISSRERSILVGVTSPENLNFNRNTQQYHTEYQNVRNYQYDHIPQRMVTIASETSPLRHNYKPNESIRTLNIDPIRYQDDSRSPNLKLDLIPV